MNSTVSIEVMQAKVERRETIVHQGVEVPCWLVVYRSDSGARSAVSRKPSSKLWVKLDGEVILQESNLKDNIRLSFTKSLPNSRIHIGRRANLCVMHRNRNGCIHKAPKNHPHQRLMVTLNRCSNAVNGPISYHVKVTRLQEPRTILLQKRQNF